ncbi:MAG: tail fiber protein [Bryobacteraceae bacterium]
MADPFVGELRLVGFNFAPYGWARAAGQLMSVTQNAALFSLLGTMYGGDGKTTFGLPNLQGNVAIGYGQGPGLQNYIQGQLGGEQTVTLTNNTVPSHNHTAYGATGTGKTTPVGNAFGDSSAGSIYSSATSPLTAMNASDVTNFGGNGPHQNLMPYQVLNWIIALQGVFPPRT